MDAITQLYGALGYCGLMLLIAYLFQKYPPKKINWWYGYRTQRSMANEEIWKAANKFSSAYMVRISWYSFLLPVACYFLFPAYNFLITVIGHSLLLFLILFATERYLDQHFDKKGNPK